MDWIRMDWTGMEWDGLDWEWMDGLDWIGWMDGLDWIGLEWMDVGIDGWIYVCMDGC